MAARQQVLDRPFARRRFLWQDDQFRTLEAPTIVEETTESLKPIDDLAVLVLFSVFEAHVRDYLVEQMKPALATLTDPILRSVAEEAVQGVKEGSFYRHVLSPLKEQGRVSADLVTQVDQVRQHRNWVAHGRPGEAHITLTPSMAFERLKVFLAELGIAIEAEERESKRPGDGRGA